MAFYQSSCIKVSDTKICPHCNASTLIKNGFTANQKQQFYCKTCTKRLVTTGYSVGKVINEHNLGGWSEVAKHRDVYDAGVGAIGLGATGLAYFGLISNPVGWTIGAGVLIYGGATMIYDAVQENKK